jgi:hypothetical protein
VVCALLQDKRDTDRTEKGVNDELHHAHFCDFEHSGWPSFDQKAMALINARDALMIHPVKE